MSNLVQRILSALVLIPLAVAVLYIGDMWFRGVMLSLWAAMSWEWHQLTQRSERPRSGLAWGLMLLGMLLLGLWYSDWQDPVFWVGWQVCAMFLLLLTVWRRDIWPLLGLAWLGAPLAAVLWMRDRADSVNLLGYERWQLLLMFLLAVWGTDIGGYVLGKTLKGPKLAPRISPNKTWSGLLGGALFASVLVGCFYLLVPPQVDVPLLAFSGFCALAMATTLVAQMGDLAESAVKRHFGKKDSGTLIPGHGGLLDRMDGVLSASVFWMVLLYMLEQLYISLFRHGMIDGGIGGVMH